MLLFRSISFALLQTVISMGTAHLPQVFVYLDSVRSVLGVFVEPLVLVAGFSLSDLFSIGLSTRQ